MAAVARKTRKEKVIAALKGGRWTPGYELTKPSVGGTEGLRRLREARADGYVFGMRHMADGTGYEYRLIKKPK
jgi:hypothetical protein